MAYVANREVIGKAYIRMSEELQHALFRKAMHKDTAVSTNFHLGQFTSTTNEQDTEQTIRDKLLASNRTLGKAGFSSGL